ncbi:type II toxin-antitoxin system Phd/YefM family antitoxin [Burkholderia sp. 4701]|nr:type II toxin-antitoxin system Phd/YefM family antitoxin [Burkholderia sp. 4701]MXN83915.1 type II toxin-antitoxin system Phd/YefM family antitoxin [Burkholderia sp. 4812]
MIRTVVERFVEHSPMAIMARLVMQCALHDEWVDVAAEIEGEPDGEQLREALFSLAVDAIATIAARSRPSDGHVAGLPAGFGAAVAALHDRMSRLRAGWGRALVQDSVELLLPATAPAPRAREWTRAAGGLRLRVLDGGATRAAPAHDADDAAHAPADGPRTLPVYDPELGMIVDLLPAERGRVHARAFVAAMLEAVKPGELWIVDVPLEVGALLSGWPRRGSAFVVRDDDDGRVGFGTPGDWQGAGTLDGGPVVEQAVRIDGEPGLALRRIEWRRGGDDMPLRVLTNAPASQLDAVQVAQLASRRWRDALPLPLPLDAVLGHAPGGNVPARAALLACGIVALAYNVFGVMANVVTHALELDARDAERLPAHIAAGVAAAYAGMMIALPPDWWRRYDQMPATTLAQIVRLLAIHVDPRSERRKRREHKLSAKSQALLRAATLERLLHDDGDDAASNVFSLRTIAMATRDFSSNPSKALRHASEALVMVTKYNRPIALLVSIDDWNRLLGEVRETSVSRLSFGHAGATQAVRPVALGEPSLN